jgi:hypothetical protein
MGRNNQQFGRRGKHSTQTRAFAHSRYESKTRGEAGQPTLDCFSPSDRAKPTPRSRASGVAAETLSGSTVPPRRLGGAHDS